MIDIRHPGAAPDDIEKDFDVAALVRTHSPGSQALGKGVRFRADGGQRLGGGMNLSFPAPIRIAVSGPCGRTASASSAEIESHADGDGAGMLIVRPAPEHPSPATLEELTLPTFRD